MTKQFREAQILFYLNYCTKRASYTFTSGFYLNEKFYKRAIRELSRPINEGER